MPVVELNNVPPESFKHGATYQTLVGDDRGSTPIRVGVQVSPPGYSTGTHSHPYLEVVTVLDGEGEAWIGEDDPVAIGPGTTLVVPADTPHGFRALGREPLRTYGVHASADRIVHRGD
ncbi:MAG: cupin domain-containing protein [Pseudomonadota bacterium]